MRSRVVATLSLLGCALVATPLIAQQPTDASGVAPQRLTVFLDCRAPGCDRNFFIQELPYVLWTQDRFDAEVHALITDLQTGSGGREATIVLIGQRRFAGRADTLLVNTPPNSTDDMRRREIVRVLKIGIGPFALRTLAGERLALGYEASASDSISLAQPVDPWNFWVYRAGGNGNVGAESQSTEYELRGSLSATRITDEWKLIADFGYSYQGLNFRPDSGPTERFMNRQGELELAALRSLSPHWSVGAGASAEVDEFRNQRFGAGAEAALEWNYFPWTEATSRQLTASAGFGVAHFDYNELTIYNRTVETRALAKVQLASEVRQAWGSLFAGARHVRYLHDFNIYSVEVSGNLSVRISRGLQLNFGGNASKVNDQLYLPAGGLDPSQILTRQRALRTAYRVRVYTGLSFTFGSIYNTFVNPRFDNYE